MNKREINYIKISNRVKLRLMKQMLSDLITNVDDITFIDGKEYIDVYTLIDKWIDKHSGK